MQCLVVFIVKKEMHGGYFLNCCILLVHLTSEKHTMYVFIIVSAFLNVFMFSLMIMCKREEMIALR